jgi:hypothetical protein
MANYKVASEEGKEQFQAEIGDKVELKLTEDEERALVAAGWLEHDKKKGKE